MYNGASVDSNGAPLRHNLTEIGRGQYTGVELGKGFLHVFDGEVLAPSHRDKVAVTFKQFCDSPGHIVTINLFLVNRVLAQVISFEEWKLIAQFGAWTALGMPW